MAWLQGLAGKAENLLNKMDQTAAETLHSEKSQPGSNASSRRPTMVSISHNRTGSNISVASDFTSSYSGQFSSDAWNEIDGISHDSAMRRSASHQEVGKSHVSQSSSGMRPKNKKQNNFADGEKFDGNVSFDSRSQESNFSNDVDNADERKSGRNFIGIFFLAEKGAVRSMFDLQNLMCSLHHLLRRTASLCFAKTFIEKISCLKVSCKC